MVRLPRSASRGVPGAASRRASRAISLLICAAAVLAAAGCGFLTPKPVDERSEGRRSGIFSGESGTFIVRSARRPAEEPPQDDANHEAPAEEGKAASK